MDVLDLFCGCGGFSTGFLQAGFNIKYAIDNWKGCEETFKYNHPGTEFFLSDIQKINPEDFKNKVDIIIGSPPCQNFSIANNNPDIEKGMSLVNEYLRWIDVIKPKFWIMENVPGLKKYLKPNNYRIEILNCANYGVPQKRIRCFSGKYFVPGPTHSKNPQVDLFGNKLEKWISVQEALKIKGILTNQQSINNCKANSPFFSSENVSRVVTTSSYLKFIPYSDKWLEKHPPINKEKVSLTISSKNDKNYFKISDIPNDICFDNLETSQCEHSQRIIRENEPGPTISTKMRSTNKIQDNQEYRRLSVRECAILQSFPNDFIFHGSLTNQYTMVGNAVPPLMSYHLAKEIKNRII
jgi:DNA (cytosine-5)-methyltransferase 1